MANIGNAIKRLEEAKWALMTEKIITTRCLDTIRRALMVILYTALMYDGKVNFMKVKQHVKNIDACLGDIDYIYMHYHNLTDVDEKLAWDITHILKAIDALTEEMEAFI